MPDAPDPPPTTTTTPPRLDCDTLITDSLASHETSQDEHENAPSHGAASASPHPFHFFHAHRLSPQQQQQQQQPQQQQLQQPGASHHSIRSSRSPLRHLLRSSTKRSRESPSPGATPGSPGLSPGSPTTTELSKRLQSTALPAAGASAAHAAASAWGGQRQARQARQTGQTGQTRETRVGLSAGGRRPQMPSFLNISSQEIDHRFLDILWKERHRLQANTDRWTRVSGPHLRVLDRYPNIQPWDRNRVRLRVPPGHTDYINASPIVLTTTATHRNNARGLASAASAVSAPRHAHTLTPASTRPPDRYIAMQGPKRASVNHVWRMVYEQLRSPGVIVMLTETHEGLTEKCYPYFPQRPEDAPMRLNEHDEFGDGFHASVRCDELLELLDGAIEQRRILLRVHKKVEAEQAAAAAAATDQAGAVPGGEETATSPVSGPPLPGSGAPHEAAPPAPHVDYDSYEDERVVYHFLYKRWPDFGVPDLADVDSFFALMRLSAEKNADADNPRIVHCSAGVGRSGTFIALEHLLREMDAGVLENYDGWQDEEGWEAEETGKTGETGETGETREKGEEGEWEDEMDSEDASDKQKNGNDNKDGKDKREKKNKKDKKDKKDQRGEAGDVTAATTKTSVVDALAAASAAAAAAAASSEANDLIFTTVNQLRKQRKTMVQAEAQYHFIYQVMRRMWLDKYGAEASGSDDSRVGSENGGDTAMAVEAEGVNGNGSEAVTDAASSATAATAASATTAASLREYSTMSEPAPKRLEVDPFVD